MGQIEVLDWLRKEALFNPKKFYTIKDITRGLDLEGNGCNGSTEQSVRRAVNKLSHFGLINCITKGWFRTFKYVKK